MSVKHAILVMIAYTLTFLYVDAQIKYNSSGESNDAGMGVERVARFFTTAYESKSAKSDDEIRWVQIDLGEKKKIGGVKILPKVVLWGYVQSDSFPSHFKIEVSDDPDFKIAIMYQNYISKLMRSYSHVFPEQYS